MPVLALWTPEDGLLGALAPLGLAAAAGTALVVDLDPGGPDYPGSQSLAGLVEEGPRRAQLRPTRRGLSVLRNGGVSWERVAPVVEALAVGWPRLVLRLPSQPPLPPAPAPIIPVRPLFPGGLFGAGSKAKHGAPAVYQQCGWQVPAPGPGPTLPPPRPQTWSALAQGLVPPPDRWVRAWRDVWSYPWQ